MHIDVSSPHTVFYDNLSFIALAYYPILHQRTKHIEIDIQFVRERVVRRFCKVHFVASNEQFADIFTKGLSAPLFQTHSFNPRLGKSNHVIVGNVNSIHLLILWLVRQVLLICELKVSLVCKQCSLDIYPCR